MYSNNPFNGSILNSNTSRTEVPFITPLYYIQFQHFNLISMVDYMIVGLLLLLLAIWCYVGFSSGKPLVPMLQLYKENYIM